jgi:hypothetical protein
VKYKNKNHSRTAELQIIFKSKAPTFENDGYLHISFALLYSLLQERLPTCTLLKLCWHKCYSINAGCKWNVYLCLIWHDCCKCCKYLVFCSSTLAVFTAVLIMSSMIPLTIWSLDTARWNCQELKYRIFRSALALSSALIHVLAHFQRTTCSQRSEYDKGICWPNLRNCLYRYNIKHNHWKVRQIFFLMISLCPLLLSNVNGGGSN